MAGESHVGSTRRAGRMISAFADFAGWRGIRALGLVAAGAVLDGAGLLLLVPILGVVVNGGEVHPMLAGAVAMTGAQTVIAKLGVLLVAFVAMSIARAVVQFRRDTVLADLQAAFVEEERNRLMRALGAAPWHRVVALRHSELTALVTVEISRVAGASQLMLQLAVTAAMLAIQLAVAFLLAPGLAAVALVLMLTGGAVFARSQTVAAGMGADAVYANKAMVASAGNFLGGLKAAAAQNAQAGFVAEFTSVQAQIRRHMVGFARRQARGRLVFGLVSALLGATVVFVGVGMLAVSPEVLIAIVLVFARMSAPATQLYQQGQQFIFALPSFEAVRAMGHALASGAAFEGAAVPPPPSGPIELRGARFVHPGGGGIESADVTIPEGSFTGIAGPSGAGKTTLIDLIVGLHQPQAGEVRVGGKTITAENSAGWRDRIAYVPQDGFLFHDTVRANLAWANPDPDAELLRAMLALSGADAVVARLPDGLDTVIGDRGALLSGGERQRLAITRALLRKPRLLVLDEAANAIDAAGEAALLERLAALSPRPTILMISHRAESLRWCDLVITVEQGRAAAAA